MQELNQGVLRLKAWPILGIAFIQLILFLAHWLVYHTVVVFWGDLAPSSVHALRIAMLVLAFSFVIAALLGFRFSNAAVALFYRLAAVWLGLLNFLFMAACLAWPTDLVLRVLHLPAHRRAVLCILFSLALLAAIYGILNARFVRVRRIRVSLPDLPPWWRGRTAVLLSDLHLGNINGLGFCRRIATMAARLRPDIVFMTGDIFDGTPVDADRLAAPFKQLSPPFGMFMVTGNHEEFGNAAHYLAALRHTGIRVLANEKALADGLTIVGIPYHDSTYPMRVRTALEGMALDSSRPSILLSHAPTRLPVAAEAGVSLQLSGHTHGGQIFPFTWFTRRAFGKFTYGLQQFNAMHVYTTYGAGTWGPPMRVGTSPEIVQITFE
jgi:predicted MPP superfamily phosphohydrolase